jgi:hypothetical protein
MKMPDDVTKALFARAIAQARTGLDEGGIPIGALLVERAQLSPRAATAESRMATR